MTVAMVAAMVIAVIVPVMGAMPAGAGIVVAGGQCRAGDEQGARGENSPIYHGKTPFRQAWRPGLAVA